jgi:hypothetical protein
VRLYCRSGRCRGKSTLIVKRAPVPGKHDTWHGMACLTCSVPAPAWRCLSVVDCQWQPHVAGSKGPPSRQKVPRTRVSQAHTHRQNRTRKLQHTAPPCLASPGRGGHKRVTDNRHRTCLREFLSTANGSSTTSMHFNLELYVFGDMIITQPSLGVHPMVFTVLLQGQLPY